MPESYMPLEMKFALIDSIYAVRKAQKKDMKINIKNNFEVMLRNDFTCRGYDYPMDVVTSQYYKLTAWFEKNRCKIIRYRERGRGTAKASEYLDENDLACARAKRAYERFVEDLNDLTSDSDGDETDKMSEQTGIEADQK